MNKLEKSPILANNINNKKSKVMNWVNDNIAMYEPDTATPEQVAGLEKRLNNARAFVTPPKNPTVNRYKTFRENQSTRNYVMAKVDKNIKAGKRPYENLSSSDIVVAEDTKIPTKKVEEIFKPDPIIDLSPTIVTETVRPIEQIIKEKADERLKKEQKFYDHVNGTDGIVNLLRPE